jgi:hypothetical protein
MGILDGVWHLLNFFGPAWGMAIAAASLAKLFWWRELNGVAWTRLAGWAAGAASLAVVAGLVWTGRDGKVLTYGAMVLACAAALWWAGWGGRRRG